MLRKFYMLAALVVVVGLVACAPPVRVVDSLYERSGAGTKLKMIKVENVSNDKRISNIWVKIVDNQPALAQRSDGTVVQTTNRMDLSRFMLEGIVLEPGQVAEYTLPDGGTVFAAINPSFEVGDYREEKLVPGQ